MNMLEGERDLSGETLYREVETAFNEAGVTYWLDQGTLLGMVREGKLLDSDHDIDLGMWEKDFREHRQVLLNLLPQKGRWVEDYKPHQLSYRSLDGQERMVNIAFYRNLGDQAVKKCYYSAPGNDAELLIKAALFCACAADKSLVKKIPPGFFYRVLAGLTPLVPVSMWRSMARFFGRLQYRRKPFVLMSVPVSFFREIEQLKIGDQGFPVPQDRESYLQLKYGAGWRQPKDEWVFWEDDGAVMNKNGSGKDGS